MFNAQRFPDNDEFYFIYKKFSLKTKAYSLMKKNTDFISV